MTYRLSLPEDYVRYLDGLVRGNEPRLAQLVRALSDRYVGKSGARSPASIAQSRIRGARAPSRRGKASPPGVNVPALETNAPARRTGADWRAAYTFYYGPVTALKVQAIATELASRDPSWPGKRALRVLDVGAGPGSATAGICLWNPEARLDVAWIDADPGWQGASLVQPWIDAGTACVHRECHDLDADLYGSFDLVLAANVVSELPGDVATRAARLDRLMSHSLAPSGVAIIVEPALRRATRDLHALRDLLLAAGWHVLAPCTGRNTCPMLANTRDWCHETRDWIQPDFHHRLDQRAGLEKDALRFAFLALARTPCPAPQPLTARIVGEVRHQKGRIRFLTCDDRSQLATWEVLQRDVRADIEFGGGIDSLRRGTLVRLPHSRGGRLEPTDSFGSAL